MGGEHTPEEFVRAAAQDGMAEVELGKLALQKTQNEQVRSFADRMIKDHSKANAELASIAKQSNLTVPTEPGAQHKAMMQQLRGKSGAEFDAAYSKHMVEDHNKAVELFRMASTMDGFDKELQSFAKKTLPTLEEHRKQAKSLAAAHGGKKMSSGEGSDSSSH
jgi:putative membrane protein